MKQKAKLPAALVRPLQKLYAIDQSKITGIRHHRKHIYCISFASGEKCRWCEQDLKLNYNTDTNVVSKRCGTFSCWQEYTDYDITDPEEPVQLTTVANRERRHPPKLSVENVHCRESELWDIIKGKNVELRRLAEAFRNFLDRESVRTIVYSRKCWWYYDSADGLWHEDSHGSTIQEMLCAIIPAMYEQWQQKQPQKSQAVIEPILTGFLHKLQGRTFREHLVRDIADVLHDPDFFNKLDADPWLLHCTNAVIDFSDRSIKPHSPSNFLSLSTRRKWCPCLDPDRRHFHGMSDEDVEAAFRHEEQIAAFFSSVFPDASVRNTVLDSLMWSLVADRPYHYFWIWVGGGANGKSQLVNLAEAAFGDYSAHIPVAFITQKRSPSESANSSIARLRHRRIGFFQEPCIGDTMNMGNVKEITGGDKLIVRELYKPAFEMKAEFQSFLSCNILPEIKEQDFGTWRRLRVVDFTTTFVPNPTHSYERQIDPMLENRIRDWGDAFLTMLILRAFNGMDFNKPIVVSKLIQDGVERYRSDSNWLHQFWKEKVLSTKSADDSISWDDLQAAINSYLRCIGQQGSLRMLEIKRILQREYFKRHVPFHDATKGEYWTHFKLRGAFDPYRSTL